MVPIGVKDDHSQIPDTRASSPWPTKRLLLLATKSISESDLILIYFFKHCIHVLLTSFFFSSSADFEDYFIKVVHCVFTGVTHRVHNCQIAICSTACCLPQKTKQMHFNELIHSDKYQVFVQLYMLSYYGHYSNFFRKNRGDQKHRKCFAEYATIESTVSFQRIWRRVTRVFHFFLLHELCTGLCNQSNLCGRPSDRCSSVHSYAHLALQKLKRRTKRENFLFIWN